MPAGDTSTTLKSQIVFFPPTEQSLNSFPGGLESSNITDTSGNALKQGTLAPAGWVNISMKIGNTDVKNFSTPIVVNMELDPKTINPNTDAPYNQGDSINIYSKSEGDENWVLESVSGIIKNPNTGKLEVPMQVSHLSVWAAANFSVACGTPFSLTLTNESASLRNFLVIIFKPNASNPLAIGTMVTSGFITLLPNQQLTTTNEFNNWSPSAGKKYFVLYYEVGNPVALQTFGPVELCGTTPPPYTIKPSDGSMVFKISIKCSNGNSVLLPKGTKVYFIDNDVYNSTLVGEGNAAHKVDPSDELPNTWQTLITDVQNIEGKDYNVVTLPQGSLSINKNYRFSVYYDTNSGNSRSREDKIFPEMLNPTQAQDPTGSSGPKLTQVQLDSYANTITPFIVNLSTCPF